jgi:4-amino-4-deoxy-L-arabinose transferase-like glycosyltransferase
VPGRRHGAGVAGGPPETTIAPPLVDLLLRRIPPELLSGASEATGELESALAKGLAAGFPALLAPLADRAGESAAMGRLLSLAGDPALDTHLLSNPAHALDAIADDGARPELGALAGALVSLALGSDAGATAGALARHAGLRNASHGHSLLLLAAPLVLGVLRDRVERDRLGAAGLGRWLGGQREALRAALPFGLERAAPEPAAASRAARSRRRAWALPLLLLLGLGALWTLLRTGGGDDLATRSDPPSVAAPPPGEGER